MIESLIAGRMVIYFFRMDGCQACEAAAPELDKFMAKHPDLTVVRLDANGPFPERLGIKLKATPTYVFKLGAEGRMKAGMMKAAEIERWLKSMGVSL